LRNQFNPRFIAKSGIYDVVVSYRLRRPGFAQKGSTKPESRRLTGFSVINNDEDVKFPSFGQFKTLMGSAGVGFEWHHIVEQSSRHGNHAYMHSLKNLVRIPVFNHRKISKFYGQEFSRDDTRSFRKVLQEQSPGFDDQHEAGVSIMRRIGGWDFALQDAIPSDSSKQSSTGVIDVEPEDP
jgi:hypothetical protein